MLEIVTELRNSSRTQCEVTLCICRLGSRYTCYSARESHFTKMYYESLCICCQESILLFLNTHVEMGSNLVILWPWREVKSYALPVLKNVIITGSGWSNIVLIWELRSMRLWQLLLWYVHIWHASFQGTSFTYLS